MSMSLVSASRACLHVCVCRPVVCVGEVVEDGGADAGHAPLAVVASSCDDRQLRSAQALLRRYEHTRTRLLRTRHRTQAAMATSC